MFVHIGKYFQSDPPADPPADTEEKKEEPGTNWSEDQQKEFDKRAAALRKSAEEAGRKKAEAEFAEKQKAEKDKAEKERLENEGKFKEAAELAEKAKNDAIKQAKEAEKKARRLELKDLFNTSVSENEFSFANPQARADAFSKIDREKAKDAETMKEAISALQKSHPHYFSAASKNGNTDADKTTRKTNLNKQDEKQREAELKARYNLRTPR